MNFYDSNHMSNLLRDHGYETSEEIKDADLVILNTCHIRDKAADKMYSDLGRIKKIYEREINSFQKQNFKFTTIKNYVNKINL